MGISPGQNSEQGDRVGDGPAEGANGVLAMGDGDDSGPADQADVEVLNEEITRLEQLLQTFLDFARPPQPEKRPFDGIV